MAKKLMGVPKDPWNEKGQSSNSIYLDFLIFSIRMFLKVNSQWNKKIEIFSQGTDNSKNFRYETLYTADYEYVNISSLKKGI